MLTLPLPCKFNPNQIPKPNQISDIDTLLCQWAGNHSLKLTQVAFALSINYRRFRSIRTGDIPQNWAAWQNDFDTLNKTPIATIQELKSPAPPDLPAPKNAAHAAEIIKRFRLFYGLSQKELPKLINWPIGRYAHVESLRTPLTLCQWTNLINETKKLKNKDLTTIKKAKHTKRSEIKKIAVKKTKETQKEKLKQLKKEGDPFFVTLVKQAHTLKGRKPYINKNLFKKKQDNAYDFLDRVRKSPYSLSELKVLWRPVPFVPPHFRPNPADL